MPVSPLKPPFAPEQTVLLNKWMPPGAPFEPLTLFRVLARNQTLMDSMLPLGRHFLGSKSTLSIRDREILILRTCFLNNCEYEWGVHVAGFAALAELSDAEIRDTCSQHTSDTLWSDNEVLLLGLCHELIHSKKLTKSLGQRLKHHYDEATILQMIALVGWYGTISLVANSTCSENEKWAPIFPDSN